ncbi:MAG: ribonuclease J, partial [Clostridia bacterium]|nr:ribonuclease J [Clostridia bacterium]
MPTEKDPSAAPVRRARKAQSSIKLRIIPLGGIDEIGKNMTAFEYGGDIVVVDCGLMFPDDDMLGIDYVIPDASYLIQNADRVRGVVYTHGHEDHIGSSPYILPFIRAPIYGTRLTLALIDNKLEEHGIKNVNAQMVKPGDTIQLGNFGVEFIKVSHSIAGACAIALHTPLGVILHTGDFKIDYTPVDDAPTDLARLAQLGNEGVLMLLAESTNVERPGYTMSEKRVGETLSKYFAEAHGRVIVATFASNVHRVQQIIDAAAEQGRKISFSGRSMVNVATIAIELGELYIPQDMLVQPDQIPSLEDHEVAIITTGSQGEAMSGLARMARQEHRFVNIKKGDTVILSATPVPGNEKFVSRLINQLYSEGADVVYEALAEVHVSGHACQEELKLIYKLVRPEYFIPIHGEYRHLMRHAKMVRDMGHDHDKVFIPQIGYPIEIDKNG